MPNVVDVDELLARLTDAQPSGTAARAWPTLTRAAEHIVADLDATSAATPHGVFPVDGQSWSTRVVELLANRPSLLTRLPMLVEWTSTGTPVVPTLAVPTAGKQAGQKNELPSDSFTVAAATAPTIIDSAIYLNISLQLEGLLPGVVEAFMALAVQLEAERQIVAAVEAATASADLATALDALADPWSPSVLVAPASALLDSDVATLDRSDAVSVIVSPAATKLSVIDPAGIIGWLAPLRQVATEPSLLGRQVARALWGQLAVQPGAAATADLA